MKNKNEVKHLVVVLIDKLKTINDNLNNDEIVEALSEANILNVYNKDLIKKLNELNA